MKKLFQFLLAYFTITMIWGYAWHLHLFNDLYAEWGAISRDKPIIIFGIIAIFIQGFVIAYLYPFYKKGSKNPILRGIQFNLIIGLMTYSAMSFATAAKVRIEPVEQFLMYHTVFQLIQFTLTGAALGFIYRPKSIAKV